MKRTLIIFLIGAFALQIKAQIQPIRNFSFENWNSYGGYLYPDSCRVNDTAAVMAGAIARKSGGTEGAYALHVGSYYHDGEVRGCYITVWDTIRAPLGGLAFDYIVQNNNTSSYNGLSLDIDFRDNNGTLLGNPHWDSPSHSNNSFYMPQTWFFSTPAGATNYGIEISYTNIYGTINEYAEVDNLRFISGAGISKIKTEMNVSYYPNPVANILSVDNAVGEADVLSVFNIEGQCVMHMNLQKELNDIDLTHISSGIYYIQFTGKKGIFRQKLIKE
jgi:hypothetical protein